VTGFLLEGSLRLELHRRALWIVLTRCQFVAEVVTVEALQAVYCESDMESGYLNALVLDPLLYPHQTTAPTS